MSRNLTVIIPTYNESKNLPLLAEALFDLSINGISLSVLIVDDDSTDGTGMVATGLAKRWPGFLHVLKRTSKRGLSTAFIEGFVFALEGDADLIAQMDSDLSHNPEMLAIMVKHIEKADVVIGSRYVKKGSIDHNWPWHRKFLSEIANRLLIPSLLGIKISDSTSGYRLWRRETLSNICPFISIKSRSFAFQVEMIFIAKCFGFKVKEIPIHFHERRAGESKMNFLVKLATIFDILIMPFRKHSYKLYNSEQ